MNNLSFEELNERMTII